MRIHSLAAMVKEIAHASEHTDCEPTVPAYEQVTLWGEKDIHSEKETFSSDANKETCSLLGYPVLYISTDLHILPCPNDDAAALGTDLSQVDDDDIGRVYRRLDRSWFLWLAQQTAYAYAKAQHGELPMETILNIKERLLLVRLWAKHHWGDVAVRTALTGSLPKNYTPPQKRLRDTGKNFNFTHGKS